MPPVKAKARVYGPFEIANFFGGEVINFLTLPFAAVVDSQIIVATEDNAVSAVQAGPDPGDNEAAYLMVVAEIAVYGSIQGFDTLLKRQQIRSFWGPMNLALGSTDAYDQVFFRARLFIGGKPGFPSDLVLTEPLSVRASVHVQPRGGVGLQGGS